MITPKHLQEWLASGASKEVIKINLQSLEGGAPLQNLAYALPFKACRNDGQLRESYLDQYSNIRKGGWWSSGLDPLNNWHLMDWGRFKSDRPRKNWKAGDSGSTLRQAQGRQSSPTRQWFDPSTSSGQAKLTNQAEGEEISQTTKPQADLQLKAVSTGGFLQ